MMRILACVTVATAMIADINQKVEIEGNNMPLDFGACNQIPTDFTQSLNKPKVKVCGTNVKVTMHMRNECNEDNAGKARQVGSCDTSLAPDSCQTFEPNQDADTIESDS